mmetsp:Transcript_41206/g.127250  ORF Transcript_41206/g.127250 Transcript_41206/m.127250 type:complete len:290 (+) Transcript_41206:93-962(+)
MCVRPRVGESSIPFLRLLRHWLPVPRPSSPAARQSRLRARQSLRPSAAAPLQHGRSTRHGQHRRPTASSTTHGAAWRGPSSCFPRLRAAPRHRATPTHAGRARQRSLRRLHIGQRGRQRRRRGARAGPKRPQCARKSCRFRRRSAVPRRPDREGQVHGQTTRGTPRGVAAVSRVPNASQKFVPRLQGFRFCSAAVVPNPPTRSHGLGRPAAAARRGLSFPLLEHGVAAVLLPLARRRARPRALATSERRSRRPSCARAAHRSGAAAAFGARYAWLRPPGRQFALPVIAR